MQVRFMQRVDYYFGIPLCFFMTIFRRLVDLLPHRTGSAPQKILFIELSEMGSAIIAYSAIKKAESAVGKENLHFLIFEKNRESVDLLNTIPHSNVITIKDSSFLTFCYSTIAALLKIRKLKIDTVIDLELFSRCTALLSYLSGADTRVGFHNYSEEGLYRGSLLTHEAYYNHTQHMALNFLALVGAISADRSDKPLVKQNFSSDLLDVPKMEASQGEVSRIRELLINSGYAVDGKKRLVIVNPDPGLLALRGWPLENYCKVVKDIVDKHSDVYVGVVGLPHSRTYYEKIKSAVPSDRVIDLTGKTRNLRELVTLLGVSHVLITNDSGPAHMATLCGVGIIVLFGPETPLRYAPLSPRVHSFFAGLSCSPCYSAANHRYSICKNNVCMKAIEPSGVLNKLEELLSQRIN